MVGDNDTGTGTGTILTSPDGTTWTSRTSGTSNELYKVIYGNSTFVTVGELGTILTSSDGITWTSRTSGTSNDLYGVTYGNSTFVADGVNGTILTSSDGTSWDNRTSGTSNFLYGVTYGNSTFVAVGHYETILTSSDGTTWTSRTSGRTNSSGLSYKNSSGWTYTDYLEGITYGNSIFVTVGRGEDGSGTIMTSSDGITWTTRTSGTTNNLWFVTHKE